MNRSTFTIGVGGVPYSYNTAEQSGGPAFSGRYEFRLFKYLAAETGVDTILPDAVGSQFLPPILQGQNLITYNNGEPPYIFVTSRVRARETLLPFGLKGILPLANGRVELSAGAGGAYGWNTNSPYYSNALLGQVSFGGRFALDHERRFWLGTTIRGYGRFGDRRQGWVPWTFELGFRFGH